MTRRFHPAAILAGALLTALTASGSMAAPAESDRTPTKLAEATQAQPAPGVEEDESATCSRSRKRLWVESEGWIVRRVTICR